MIWLSHNIYEIVQIKFWMILIKFYKFKSAHFRLEQGNKRDVIIVESFSVTSLFLKLWLVYVPMTDLKVTDTESQLANRRQRWYQGLQKFRSCASADA